MSKMKRFSIAIMLLLVLSMITTSLTPVSGTQSAARAASAVKLNKSKLTLYVGKTYTLRVTGTTDTVSWSSSKAAVATVTKSGKVIAKKTGKAIITATVNSSQYTCTVTVKEVAVTAKNQTTVYGKVTSISGKKVTLALGTLNNPGTPPGGQAGTMPSGAPSKSSDATTGTGVATASSTTTGGTDGSKTGTPMTGQSGQAPEFLTLTGDKITITISDSSILTKESMPAPQNQSSDSSSKTTAVSGSSAALTDITVGSILKITYAASVDNLTAVVIMGGGQPGGGQAAGGQQGNQATGGQPGNATTISTGTGAYSLKDGENITGGSYSSTNADENAIRAENNITASLTEVSVAKTAGAASSSDASSFYGLNSAILALNGSTLNITGGSVTAAAEGANGVFAYNGATVNIKNTTINVSGGNAGGIEVAGGGIMNATNLTVTSKIKAAIRSDRGGGTMTVNGGTYTTSGSTGAPAIYSTAAITVNDAVLSAEDSEAVVVEGLNSVTLNNCTVTGNMNGTYSSSSNENIHNVMLYQSMSGDAEVGNSSFSMTGGSLTSKNGDMFYVTNTDCTIYLSKVSLTPAEGTKLLVVAGNNNSRGWGTVGANGGDCDFKVSGQTLSGDITVDSISKLSMIIADTSSFTGSINSDKTNASALSVTLDSTSTWTLTKDSYITEFNGSMSNVNTNGHVLYVNGVAMK